jgi:type II secretory pathway pseudopilin PulG
MTRKPITAFRRLSVDFGNESACLVPIQGRHPLRPAKDVPRYVVQNGKVELQVRQSRIENPLQHSNAPAASKQSGDGLTLQRSRRPQGAFTLVEILVVLVLLSLIVLALMAVFSGIQRAFRASLTQTDTLESGRAVMDLIASDLEAMTPSDGISNIVFIPAGPSSAPQLITYGPINFCAALAGYASPPSPLMQPLVSSPSGQMRTNILENIFILSKNNINGVQSWIGTGYSVSTHLPDGTLYPLYRFYMATNAASGYAGMIGLYTNFFFLNYTNSSEWSHLMDGVVNLTARAYDTNGLWITNGYAFPQFAQVQNVFTLGSTLGVSQCWFCSNAMPASVQIELGTLEDRTLQHAEALNGANQASYLSNSVGQVHIFRRRVWIRNFDPTAYQ